MTPRQQADQIIAMRKAALVAESARLRSEIRGLVGITMSQRQVDEVLQLPAVGSIRVACGRVW